MHPAISVIFFTTLSGAGFGLMALLGLGHDVGGDGTQAWVLSALAFGMSVAGLLASTFHLGHPERAWRAFSQWRTSWLSREGVLAVLTLVLFAAYTWLWLIRGERVAWLGYLVVLSSGLTVFATAMIYAQLRTVPHWNTALTPVCYLLFSLASSSVLFMALRGEGAAGATERWLIVGGLILVASWVAKWFWWRRAARTSLASVGASTEDATGLGAMAKGGKVRLLESPHSGANYLTREMVHKIGRKHARTLRRLAVVLGLGIPLVVMVVMFFMSLPNVALVVAFLSLMLGLLAERWLFFAEAEHSVAAYY